MDESLCLCEERSWFRLIADSEKKCAQIRTESWLLGITTAESLSCNSPNDDDDADTVIVGSAFHTRQCNFFLKHIFPRAGRWCFDPAARLCRLLSEDLPTHLRPLFGYQLWSCPGKKGSNGLHSSASSCLPGLLFLYPPFSVLFLHVLQQKLDHSWTYKGVCCFTKVSIFLKYPSV